MVFGAQGGNSAGIATGKIQIDTSQLQAAGNIVQNVSQRMGQAMGRFGTDAEASQRRVQGALRETGQVAQQTGGLIESVFSAAFLAKGVQAANNLNRLNTLFKVLSGSQEKTNQNMAQLQKLSERTGQPMLRLQESAVGLLSSIKGTNADLGQTLSLAQRLAVLDPVQGIEGASTALREFLSGDVQSLARRFELSRSQLNALKQQAGGDVNKLIAGLDDMINKIGLTEDALAEMNAEGVNAFENAGAAAQEAIGRAFEPARQILALLAQGFVAVNQQQPGLVQTGIAVAGITAAMIALKFATDRARQSFKELKTSAAGVTLGRAAAVGFGVQAGLLGARALADRTNLQSGDLNRIRQGEDPGAILQQRLSQALVIFIDKIREAAQTMVSIVGIFAVGGQVIRNAFDLLGAALNIGVGILQAGFGKIQEAIGNVLVGLADAFSGLFDTTNLRQSGQANQQLGQQNIAGGAERVGQGAARLQQGIGLTDQQAAKIAGNVERMRNSIDTLFRGVEQSAVNFLFPAMEKTQEEAQQTGGLLGILGSNLGDAATAFKKVQGEVKDLTDDFNLQAERLAQARDIQDSRESFDNALQRGRQIRDFNRGLAQSDADFYNGRAQQIERFNEGLKNEELKAQADIEKQKADFRREDVRRAEDFGRKLQEIESNTRIGVIEAASRLDARRVLETQRRGEQQVNQATTDFEIENKRRAEDFQLRLQEQATNLQAQRNQRVAAFQQQLADQQAAYNLQRQRRIESFQLAQKDAEFDRALRLQRQAEDRAREDAIRTQDFNRRIQKMYRQFASENNLWQGFVNTVQTGTQYARQNILALVNDVGRQAAAARAIAFGVQALGGLASKFGLPGFAHGGNPPLNRPVRVNSLESALTDNRLALFTRPTTIFPPQQTQRMLAGAGAGGGGDFTWTGNLVLGDIGDRSDDQVIRLINQGLMEVFSKGGREQHG